MAQSNKIKYHSPNISITSVHFCFFRGRPLAGFFFKVPGCPLMRFIFVLIPRSTLGCKTPCVLFAAILSAPSSRLFICLRLAAIWEMKECIWCVHRFSIRVEMKLLKNSCCVFKLDSAVRVILILCSFMVSMVTFFFCFVIH